MTYLEAVGAQEEHTTAAVGGDQNPRATGNDKFRWIGLLLPEHQGQDLSQDCRLRRALAE